MENIQKTDQSDTLHFDNRSQYIQYIRQTLTKHFRNSIDNSDDHQVHVFTDPRTVNAVITYTPKWLDDHNDNDGNIMPPRTITVLATGESPKHNQQHKTIGKFVKLSNSYFIHGQRFTGNDYLLNFNFRDHNGMSDSSRKQFQADLKKQFNIQVTNTGLLVSPVKKSVLDSFVNLIKAIQYIMNNGDKYLISVKDVRKTAHDEIVEELGGIDKARAKYLSDKRAHTPRSKAKPKDKKPKAPGRVVADYSSTKGTPREKRYARERKARRAKLAYEKKHPQAKPKKPAFTIKGQYVTTSGRFSKPLAQIKKLITAKGGIVQNSLTKKTTCVVCNKPNKSKKYQTAKQRGLKIVSESVLNK